MKFKEFCTTEDIDEMINRWVENHPKVKIIDLKYSANGFGSHVLMIYEEGK